MPKTVTLRLDDDTYESLVTRAKAEHRPLSNYIEMAALHYTAETAFADVEEMHDILNDTGLVKRIRQGIRDAQQKKGRFVDDDL